MLLLASRPSSSDCARASSCPTSPPRWVSSLPSPPPLHTHTHTHPHLHTYTHIHTPILRPQAVQGIRLTINSLAMFAISQKSHTVVEYPGHVIPRRNFTLKVLAKLLIVSLFVALICLVHRKFPQGIPIAFPGKSMFSEQSLELFQLEITDFVKRSHCNAVRIIQAY